MAAWLVWLLVGGVLGAAELATLTLVLGMLAGAAFVAAATAAAGASDPLQGVVFVVVAVALLGLVRPVARRHLTGPTLRTGTAALVGRRGVALTDVSDAGGRVKLGGEEWSARPYAEGTSIEAGVPVDVLAIEGATALVAATPGHAIPGTSTPDREGRP